MTIEKRLNRGLAEPLPGIGYVGHQIVNHFWHARHERLLNKVRGGIVKEPSAVEPVRGDHLNLIFHVVWLIFFGPAFFWIGVNGKLWSSTLP